MSRFVLDPGSSTIKFGHAEATLPSLVVPSVMAKKAAKRALLKKHQDDASNAAQTLFGEDVHHALRERTGGLTVKQPMERGKVVDWEAMEHLLNHCFEELEEEAEDASLVFTVPPYNPREHAERLGQVLFETFNLAEVAMVPAGQCALYASGRTTGIVLESGHGVTSVTSVFDSYIIERGMNRIDFAGQDVSEHLKRIMFEQGYNFTSEVDAIAVQAVKEHCCLVSEDYQIDLDVGGDEIEYELPDGTEIKLTSERFRAPEVLFNPAVLQLEYPPLGDLVANAIKQCPIDTRQAISSNIVLSGGNTMFAGFEKRLQEETARHFPGMFGSVNVVAPSDRRFNVWAGASVLAGMPSFESHFVTRDAYDEYGPAALVDHQGGGDAAEEEQEEADE